MRRNLIVTVLLLLASQTSFAKNVKTLNLGEADVGQVRVAIGYSTLLQFDTRPTQAIVGDQDSFKVEYVANSIAIKPLISGVSTNLFVMTEYGKFNFRISAGRGFEPDYILRIKRKAMESRSASSAIVTKPIGVSKTANGMTLKLISIASTKTNRSLIYSFVVESKDKKTTFQPGDFEILQAGRSLPIENIYLERLSLDKGQRAQGMILIHGENVRGRNLTTLRFHPESQKAGIQISVTPI